MQPASVAPSASPPSQRILSVDVLRGFDMFWIVGGEWVVIWLLDLCPDSIKYTFMPQFFHVEWEGFHFVDLIFALFLFLVGMSAVFSLEKTVAQEGVGRAYRRVLRRTAVLFLLGVIMYGGLHDGWPNVRVLGVLQRIATCYFFTAVAVIHLRPRWIVVALAALLAGYWALLSFVPLPGAEAISFAVEKNWANYLDAHYLPGKLYGGTWDPEGLLSTLPSIANCLLGVLAANLLKSERVSAWGKVGWLVGGGAAGVMLGLAWGGYVLEPGWLANIVNPVLTHIFGPIEFPVIKNIWTSSFVLVTGGYSCILMGIFYAVIDIWNFHRWTTPFVWLGTNAITIYLLHNLISFRDLAGRLVGMNQVFAQFLLNIPLVHEWAVGLKGDEAQAAKLCDSLGQLMLAIVGLALTLILVRFLSQRKIFLRA